MDEPVVAVKPEAPAATPRRWRRRLVRVGVVLLVIAVGAGVRFERFLFRNNQGTVAAGRLYRSAQPGRELAQTANRLALKSVLNLRGGDTTDWWYANEVQVAKQHDIAFYDLPLSAGRPPSRRELITLIDVLERAPYPMLVHCKSGADRTGLAAAVYRLVILGEPPEQAKQAFSYDYAHIPLLGPERLHEPIDAYARWLAWRRRPHSPETFRIWAVTQYRAGPEAEAADAGNPFEPLQPGPRAEVAAATRSRPLRK
jgi:protein tyrosine phosphatase (PTP) superfamily phosphohydrolase (DUF442 family)